MYLENHNVLQFKMEIWGTAMSVVCHCPINQDDGKKKNGQAYYVKWDSDASSAFDDASIAFKKATSLFSKPHCLMVKSDTKISTDDHDEDDDEGCTYDELC
jgi:hypothetical protein